VLQVIENFLKEFLVNKFCLDDEFKEIEHFYQNMRDCYDNARDEVDGDDGEQEDDDF